MTCRLGAALLALTCTSRTRSQDRGGLVLMSSGDSYLIGIVGGWLVTLCGCWLAYWALYWLFRALSWLFA